VNPTTRMSLTEALSHPWLSSSVGKGIGGAPRGPPTNQHGLESNLSDVSELSELPDEDGHGAGVNGDASMVSTAPSVDIMPGVHSAQRARAPLERRSKVLARELEAEAEAQDAASAAASSPQGGAGKRQRESAAADVAMAGGESGGDSDGGAAAMDVVEPQPRAAKRGRRTQNRQSASASPPTAVGDGNGNGRVLRSRAAAPAGSGRR